MAQRHRKEKMERLNGCSHKCMQQAGGRADISSSMSLIVVCETPLYPFRALMLIFITRANIVHYLHQKPTKCTNMSLGGAKARRAFL